MKKIKCPVCGAEFEIITVLKRQKLTIACPNCSNPCEAGQASLMYAYTGTKGLVYLRAKATIVRPPGASFAGEEVIHFAPPSGIITPYKLEILPVDQHIVPVRVAVKSGIIGVHRHATTVLRIKAGEQERIIVASGEMRSAVRQLRSYFAAAKLPPESVVEAIVPGSAKNLYAFQKELAKTFRETLGLTTQWIPYARRF